ASPNERVGVVVSEHPAGWLYFDVVTRCGRELADQIVIGGGPDHAREIVRRRYILTGKSGRIAEMRVGHAEGMRLFVHCYHERRDAARIVPRKARGGAVF